MTEMLQGIEGVEASQDDSLVAGRTMEEHDEKFRKVVDVIQGADLKLNLKKCLWREPFLGHKFSEDGVRPDPDKVRAVFEVVDVHSKFSYNNAKKDIQWSRGLAQEKSFDEVKQALNATTLTFYDPQKPITVSADASSFGIGAVILQEENNRLKPIAFASRTLLPAESRYAQIEKDCLDSVWACEKFDRYLRGLQQLKFLSYHKPLVPLINESDLNAVPIRRQRLLMRMMKYNPKAQHVTRKRVDCRRYSLETSSTNL